MGFPERELSCFLSPLSLVSDVSEASAVTGHLRHLGPVTADASDSSDSSETNDTADERDLSIAIRAARIYGKKLPVLASLADSKMDKCSASLSYLQSAEAFTG